MVTRFRLTKIDVIRIGSKSFEAEVVPFPVAAWAAHEWSSPELPNVVILPDVSN